MYEIHRFEAQTWLKINQLICENQKTGPMQSQAIGKGNYPEKICYNYPAHDSQPQLKTKHFA